MAFCCSWCLPGVLPSATLGPAGVCGTRLPARRLHGAPPSPFRLLVHSCTFDSVPAPLCAICCVVSSIRGEQAGPGRCAPAHFSSALLAAVAHVRPRLRVPTIPQTGFTRHGSRTTPHILLPLHLPAYVSARRRPRCGRGRARSARCCRSVTRCVVLWNLRCSQFKYRWAGSTRGTQLPHGRAATGPGVVYSVRFSLPGPFMLAWVAMRCTCGFSSWFVRLRSVHMPDPSAVDTE